MTLVFIFFAYGLFTTTYHSGFTTGAEAFPSFSPPDLAFQTLPADCSGLTDCIEFVGLVIVNIVLGVIFTVLIIALLLVFFMELVATLTISAITGIDGAPAWINAIILTIFAAATGIIIYKSIRKGDTTA